MPVVVASWLPWLAMAVIRPDPDTRGVARDMLWSAAFAVLMLQVYECQANDSKHQDLPLLNRWLLVYTCALAAINKTF